MMSEVETEADESEESGGTSGRTVLVVDDCADLAENLADLLEDAGYSADWMDDPRRALSHAQSRHYDLVVLDVEMPHINGIGLWRCLRRRLPEAQFVFVTGTCDRAIRAELARCPVPVIDKPFVEDRLLELALRGPDRGRSSSALAEARRSQCPGANALH